MSLHVNKEKKMVNKFVSWMLDMLSIINQIV